MEEAQCEDCKFANWDMTFFPDGHVTILPGELPKEPYSVQFELYCSKHDKFILESEITGVCPDGIYGENNYYDVCKKFYQQREEYLKQLKEENDK